MKSLIIFAGAGASYGVAGDKYPMALDFKKRLPNSITESPLYHHLMTHLRHGGSEDGIDIEHILWELGRLNGAIEEWTRDDRFASRLLTTNQIHEIAQYNGNGPAVHSQFLNLQTIARSLQDQINERVYEFYSPPPNEEQLKRSWVPLFDKVVTADFDRVDIVTTNYDLVIEAALEASPLERVSTGFTQGYLPGIALSAWRDTVDQGGMFTKLHGSVDWKLGNGGSETDPVIRRGHPEFDGDHGKRLILYPGFKGVPTKEPFVVFHDYFRRRIVDATHMLFIGFAFRDEHINELILSNKPPECRVAVVNPASELPALAFLESAKHLKQGFGIDPNGTLLTTGGVPPLSMTEMAAWMK